MASVALVVGLGVALAGCDQIGMLKAKMAFKSANTLYQQQDYRKAAQKYEEALEADPRLTYAYFFLGNSYDNLYKPGRKGESAANDVLLTKAIDNYRKAAEVEQDPKIKRLALEYLVSAYGPDKLNDPSQAEPMVKRMIELDPKEPANYFALANIYEQSGNYDLAEQTLIKAREVRPNDPAVYIQLAGYYNRQGEFDKTIEALEARAQKEPSNPEAYYTIATYYWDKAYRDFRLREADKKKFVQSGVDAVDKAISLKNDYMEALVYKNLLLRLQANLEKDQAKQQALLKEADRLRDLAQEIRKKRAAGVGN
ncbi:MAG TPA: tetratricopeptide repeat protein [Vicinamibacterales bacterium]|nr:tetratricopeptide repeat protein [Vicinamibacterales bacterium]